MCKIINKMGASTLLFLFLGSPSFSAAFASLGISQSEKKVTIISESIDSMAEVPGILYHHGVKLAETAFFFDFDENIATLIAHWDGQTYHVLPSPDLSRTYGSSFEEAKKELNLNPSSDSRLLEPFYTLEPYTHYEILDDGIVPLIAHLKSSGANVGVCSGLHPTIGKLRVLEKVDIDPNDYTYASDGKANTINQYLEYHLGSKRISAIALMDNSFKYALENYIAKMGTFAKSLSQTQDVPEIKIIAIEFTKFSKIATPSNIKAELENMMDTLSKF